MSQAQGKVIAQIMTQVQDIPDTTTRSIADTSPP